MVYLRFIGDALFICTGSKEQLVRDLNKTQLNLSTKFQNPALLFLVDKCISGTTNFKQKYIENKPIGRASFIKIQNIRKC